MSRNLRCEPCTLVYTNLPNSPIAFEDFYLIIRSLHNYMVEAITPNAELSNVHVKLGYQASVKNVREKLGGLQQHISVSKLSSFVKDTELLRLEELKKQYGIIVPGEPSAPSAVPGRPKKRAAVYKPRPAPYKVPFQDAQDFPGPSTQVSAGDCESDGEPVMQ